jgi:hypothetical protein
MWKKYMPFLRDNDDPAKLGHGMRLIVKERPMLLSIPCVLTSVALLSVATAAMTPAIAEVTNPAISASEQPTPGDRSFGSSGTAEKITGHATIALDRTDRAAKANTLVKLGMAAP